MPDDPDDKNPEESVDVSVESTMSLLERIRHGDPQAKNALAARCLPILTQWAHGRLPHYARGIDDTDDLVQVTLLKSLERVEEFDHRRQGSFLAYLRSALMNKIRDHIRAALRRPQVVELQDYVPDRSPNPERVTIGIDEFERYESALEKLPSRTRQAIILRKEMGLTHQEVANELGYPTWEAAAAAVRRGFIQLTGLMEDGNA